MQLKLKVGLGLRAVSGLGIGIEPSKSGSISSGNLRETHIFTCIMGWFRASYSVHWQMNTRGRGAGIGLIGIALGLG